MLGSSRIVYFVKYLCILYLCTHSRRYSNNDKPHGPIRCSQCVPILSFYSAPCVLELMYKMCGSEWGARVDFPFKLDKVDVSRMFFISYLQSHADGKFQLILFFHVFFVGNFPFAKHFSLFARPFDLHRLYYGYVRRMTFLACYSTNAHTFLNNTVTRTNQMQNAYVYNGKSIHLSQ